MNYSDGGLLHWVIELLVVGVFLLGWVAGLGGVVEEAVGVDVCSTLGFSWYAGGRRGYSSFSGCGWTADSGSWMMKMYSFLS